MTETSEVADTPDPIGERETLSSLVAQRVAAAMADGPVIAAEGVAHRAEGGHWLVFNMRALSGPVTGCHCGFVAELDADNGWGDSVLDHFEEVVRAETAAEVRALRAENEVLQERVVFQGDEMRRLATEVGARVGVLRRARAERDSALAELAAARDELASR